MADLSHHLEAVRSLAAELEVIRPEDPNGAQQIVDAANCFADGVEHPEADAETAKLLADIRYVQGVLDHAKGDLQSAMKNFDEAIRIGQQSGDQHRCIQAMRSAALCYENAGRQAESTRLILDALEQADSLGDVRLRALVSMTLCALYQAQGAWSSLLGQAERTAELAERVDDPHLRSRAYSGVGVALGYCERSAEGLAWIDRAEAGTCGSGRGRATPAGSRRRRVLLRRAGHLDQALALADQLPEEFDRIPAADAARLAVMLAEAVLEAGDSERALELLDRAEIIATDAAMTAHLIEYHRVAAKLYERRGEAQRALDAMRQYVGLDRQIRGRRAEARLVDIERHFERELAKKSEEIHQLKNVELAQKNTELAALNQQKDAILSVLAHDLRNPLAAVHMLGEFLLHDAEQRTDDDAVDQLRSLGNAAAEMTRIIDQLLEGRPDDTASCADAPGTADERTA